MVQQSCVYYEMFILLLMKNTYNVGHAVAQLVEALRYKSEGYGFDVRWCQ